MLRVCFIGDIVGRIGRRLVSHLIPHLQEEYRIDLFIANGENAAGGFGIIPRIATLLFSYGVDVITTGNHTWDKKEIIEMISTDPRILRPANFPEGAPGVGSTVVYSANGDPVGIVNICGRVFLPAIDCPFRRAREEVEQLREKTPIIIVDAHGEATSEKMALGYYLDGQVSAVIGTHTHVQTADECILPSGTAYITDAGMTGAIDSIIGMEKEDIIHKFLTGMPVRYKVAKGPGALCGVIVGIDTGSGKALSMERIRVKGDTSSAESEPAMADKGEASSSEGKI